MLFDIVHSDCSQLIRIPQDLDFLEDQRSARKMAMGSEDREFKVRNEKRMKRLQDNLNRSQLELEIFALRHQFKLSKHELQGIRRIVRMADISSHGHFVPGHFVPWTFRTRTFIITK